MEETEGASGGHSLCVYFWVTFVLRKNIMAERKNSSKSTVL